MSNIVTIVRNPTDTQVEINGREILGVTTVNVSENGKFVTLIFEAAQVNIIGENAKRSEWVYIDGPAKPISRWQRFKAWWKRMSDAFEAWQNGDYTDY